MAVALSLAIASIAVTTAQAQDNPNATVEEQAQTSDLDTDVTPVAKETDLWTLVHGAPYPKTETVENSLTSFDTELFAVSFENTTIGLAGGSACAIEPVQQRGEDDREFGPRADNCEGTDGTKVPRVPALYRYDEPPDDDPGWDRLKLPREDEDGFDDSGYIGAIAWIDSERALIVGGTGTYPRREPDYDGKQVSDPAKADVAGKARAWVYARTTDAVEELDLSSLTPDTSASGEIPARAGMRGLSAVDCYRDPNPGTRPATGPRRPDPDPDIKLCFAGALGQIWEFRDDRFTGTRVDALSPSAELQNPQLFTYRVRDIALTKNEPPTAVAVTSGCCGAGDVDNRSRTLIYQHDPNPNSRDGWTSPTYQPQPPRWYVGVNDRPDLPDSYYSLMYSSGSGSLISISTVATPGGPEEAGEPPSVITDGAQRTPGRPGDAPARPETDHLLSPAFVATGTIGSIRTDGARNLSLATARLLSGSGDVGGISPARPPSATPDGKPDWVVGELRSTEREGLGAQGLVVATALKPGPLDAVNALGPSAAGDYRVTNVPGTDELADGYEPIDQEKLDAHRRSSHYLLPSYTANQVEIVGAQEDGWAVGDHGAILRLSAKATQAAASAQEPKPPRLTANRSKSLSDRDAYEDSRPPLPASTGAVPPQGEETVQLEEPEMLPSGPVGAVEQIVMSRDGSEGWAIGNDTGGRGWSFSHFDGRSWSVCDPHGIEGISEPDPACEAMKPLAKPGAPRFIAASRVPLENDPYPENDDELEIVAVGHRYEGPETNGQGLPAFVRYSASERRWRFEEPERLSEFARTGNQVSGLVDVAFTSPADGWVLANVGGNQGGSERRVFHFTDDVWVDCVREPAPCGESTPPRLPKFTSELEGLTVAGERVYAYGSRTVGDACVTTTCTGRHVPLILYHDRDEEWTDGAGEAGTAGFDPAFSNPGTEQAGRVESLSVARGAGGYEGWAVGTFGAGIRVGDRGTSSHAVLMRLGPEEGWRPFRSPGAFEDYMFEPLLGDSAIGSPDPGGSKESLQVTYPAASEPNGSFIGQEGSSLARGGRLFGLDAARDRFELVESARPQKNNDIELQLEAVPHGQLTAIAPDGKGGFWAAVSGYMFHHTDRAPKPVFEEAASPFGARGVELRDLDAGLDGSVWAATDSDRIFRYDRIAGWEETRVGWDPGRVVTRASQAAAIAIGSSGEGLAVGEAGRIANLSASEISLDPAAGRSCALGDAIPCGTSRDLKAVDLAPDGAAIAAGEGLSLLWRPPGGDFRAAPKPSIASSTTIAAVSYPTPTRAYLATDNGRLFRGDSAGVGDWTWKLENADARGELISLDADRRPIPFADIDVDAAGHGYAVGQDGLVLERSAESGWRRIHNPYPANLTAVSLPKREGDGVLIGGENGLVLTGQGSELGIASPAGYVSGVGSGDVIGLAYLPGSSEGSVDAWAGIGGSGDGTDRLLRYRSHPADPTLDPATALAPLPDAPAHDDGELSLAAFGKADCDLGEGTICPEMTATTTTNEVVSDRIVDELAELRESGELDLALLSGDATDSAGRPGSSLADYERINRSQVTASPSTWRGQLKHRRYAELVASDLEDAGIPLFGALGGQDLSETFACGYEPPSCHSAKEIANAGENYAWREAFDGRAEPWGSGEDVPDVEVAGTIELEPAAGSEDNSLAVEDQSVDPDGEDGAVPEAKAAIGGAATHYALDATREGEPIARVVVVDTSLGSLAANDPMQQPHELGGGQLRFLERMICTEGQSSTFGDRCTRQRDQKAIVVSNTPTYSYGPGALTHTAADANVFEALMLKHRVDLVVSGALGYNGLYYTLAPGVHEPCPAGSYPEAPPAGKTPDCLAGPAGPAEVATERAPAEADPASLVAGQGLTGAYPTLIASGAGGKFGPEGREPPDGAAGQWHGYSLARLGLEGEIVVEQRPILDWIGLDASSHTLAPKSRLRLNGYGRSPISTTTMLQHARAFHYEISTPAITHRYDLLLADPDEPWLPCEAADINCAELQANLSRPPATEGASQAEAASAAEPSPGAENPCSPYLCLPSRIGSVDDQSGQVRAGDGRYPETFAIAMLSVNEKLATYPLVFKRSPSFMTSPSLRTAGAPQTSGARTPAPPPPPPPPGLPQIPNVEIPQIPPPPAIPQLTAATPPEPQPPAPPAPPPPSQQPSALDLSVAPPGVSISTPTALIQPPTPPVNPAPPGGARREARQRQAAAQKGGADSGAEGAGEGTDLADSPRQAEGAEMTRRDVPRPAEGRHHFSRVDAARAAHEVTLRPEARDAVSPAAPWVAGLALSALALALSFSILRPGPRRRQPEIPAPAWRSGGR